jgi:hypothetical protein
MKQRTDDLHLHALTSEIADRFIDQIF